MGPKDFHMNILVVRCSEYIVRLRERTFAESRVLCDSGAYRKGFTFVESKRVQPGTYVAILASWEPTLFASFKFAVKATEGDSVSISEL